MKKKKSKTKILLFDIETSPNVSYTWGKYDQNVIDFNREWQLLTFAYKWLGEKNVHCVTRLDFKDQTDKSITKALWKLLDKADVVIAHNGDNFDNRKARAKFIEHGLPPTSPFASVDTKKIAKQYFKFNSNSLDDLGKLLGVGRKVRVTEGFDLWLRCMAGDRTAFSAMTKYNRQDVRLLEAVYLKLLPWADKHPNVARADGKPKSCPKCGGTHLNARGTFYTKVSSFRRYRCMSCGGWCRSRLASTTGKPEIVNL